MVIFGEITAIIVIIAIQFLKLLLNSCYKISQYLATFLAISEKKCRMEKNNGYLLLEALDTTHMKTDDLETIGLPVSSHRDRPPPPAGS